MYTCEECGELTEDNHRGEFVFMNVLCEECHDGFVEAKREEDINNSQFERDRA